MQNAGTGEALGKLFGYLDKCRNLPSYSVERRVDGFLAIYLKDILEALLPEADTSLRDLKLCDSIIPECPIARDPAQPTNGSKRREIHADYVLFKKGETKHVFLVELKTDLSSITKEQCKAYRQAAKYPDKLWDHLVNYLNGKTSSKKTGLRPIKPLNTRKKYCHLLYLLHECEQLSIPQDLIEFVWHSASKQGSPAPSQTIEVIGRPTKVTVVYLLPSESDAKDKSHLDSCLCLYFDQIAKHLMAKHHDDAIALRLAESLQRWHDTRAGEAKPADAWGQ